MKRGLLVVSHIGLAPWVGGIACVAFLVAPSVFRVHREDTDVAAQILRPVFAGIDYLGVVTAALLVVVYPGRWKRGLAGFMGLCAAASVFFVAPRVDGRNFYHRLDEILWTAILLGGIALLATGIKSAREAA